MVNDVPIRLQFDGVVGAESGFDKASLNQRLQPLVQRARQTARTDELVAAIEGAEDFFA